MRVSPSRTRSLNPESLCEEEEEEESPHLRIRVAPAVPKADPLSSNTLRPLPEISLAYWATAHLLFSHSLRSLLVCWE